MIESLDLGPVPWIGNGSIESMESVLLEVVFIAFAEKL